MSTKEVLLEMAETLPSDASLLAAAAELEARHAALADAEIESPAWHEPILKERLQLIADGKEKFLTLDEAREMLRKERA